MKIVRKRIPSNIGLLIAAFEKHVDEDSKKNDQVNFHILSLKERLDKMNGAIPFIKEKVGEMQGMLIDVHSKIDLLHQMNAKQDIQIAKDSEVINWIKKIILYGLPSAIITLILGYFLNKLMF